MPIERASVEHEIRLRGVNSTARARRAIDQDETTQGERDVRTAQIQESAGILGVDRRGLTLPRDRKNLKRLSGDRQAFQKGPGAHFELITGDGGIDGILNAGVVTPAGTHGDRLG